MIEIDVAHPQVQDLVHPKTAAAEETEDLRHDQVAQRRTCVRSELVDGLQQLLNLGLGQDAGTETAADLHRQRALGDVSAVPEPAQVDGELAGEGDTALLCSGALVGLPGEPLPQQRLG